MNDEDVAIDGDGSNGQKRGGPTYRWKGKRTRKIALPHASTFAKLP